MDSKVYYPEEIDDKPIIQVMGDEAFVAKYGKNILTPEQIENRQFPNIITANEVIAVSLDTKKKRILGEFQFSELGAIKVGSYENGVSGEIAISPSGIVATNTSGDTTFAIDGETGDATFAGTLEAGVVVATGALVVGTNVGIGSAVDSAGVTTIIGNTVTTGFVNALSITAGSVNAENVTAGTLTGQTFRTASSGARVEIAGGSDDIEFFKSDGDKIGEIDDNGTDFYIKAHGGRHLALSCNDSNKRVYINSNMDLNDNQIWAVEAILFTESSSRPTDSDAIYYYKSGGTYGFRSRMEGGNWSFDQSGV